MNIFKILSTGDGSINEPNVSAFLAYLLDPHETHGLNNLFLNRFLKPITEKFKNDLNGLNLSDIENSFSKESLSVKVDKEVRLKTKDVNKNSGYKHKDIDILVELFDKNEVKYVFAIEVKINDSSIKKNDSQLVQEYEGLIEMYKDKPIISFVYLTSSLSEKSKIEFKKLENTDVKVKEHYVWYEDDSSPSIIKILKTILSDENNGAIDPIHSYVKSTIKSFIMFINSDFSAYKEISDNLGVKFDYKKPLMSYIREVYDDDTFWSKRVSVKDLKNEFIKRVKLDNGDNSPSNFAVLAKTQLSIVNERNRIHYQVRTPDSDDKNLFYYVNPANLDVYKDDLEIKRFNQEKPIDDIIIYYGNKIGNKVEELSEYAKNIYPKNQ